MAQIPGGSAPNRCRPASETIRLVNTPEIPRSAFSIASTTMASSTVAPSDFTTLVQNITLNAAKD
jgi:hypothetical protein